MTTATKFREWRTVWGTVLFGGMMVVVVAICPAETRSGVATTAIGGLGALGVALAAKAYGDARETAKTPPATIKAISDAKAKES